MSQICKSVKTADIPRWIWKGVYKMTPRERVMSTIEHRNDEEGIPFSLYAGSALAVYGEKLLKLLYEYPCDFFDTADLNIPDINELRKSMKTTDAWGCVWVKEDPLIAGRVEYAPLADWNNFKSYRMPDIKRVTQKDIDKADKVREKYPVWAGIDQFFQVMQNIRGSEQLFMDFYEQPEEIEKLINRMLNEYHLPLLEEQLKLKPDIIGTGDDWGTQTALLINPELWKRFFKPVYKKFTEITHQAGAKIWFHTCGYTMEILEEFIDIGIDVVNPQITIMDVEQYGRIARNRITVNPDLNRQDILINGTPDEVEEHIISVYNKLGTEKGGLIGYCPIEYTVPFENIKAVLKTVANYKKRRK